MFASRSLSRPALGFRGERLQRRGRREEGFVGTNLNRGGEVKIEYDWKPGAVIKKGWEKTKAELGRGLGWLLILAVLGVHAGGINGGDFFCPSAVKKRAISSFEWR